MTTIADMESQSEAQSPVDPVADTQPEPPPKTIFHIERENLGEGVGEMVKPYRRFYGRVPKDMVLEKVEVEWDSQDPNRGPTQLWLVPAGYNDVPGGEGSSDRMSDGRIYTFCPEKFGTDSERMAAGKKPLKRLDWEEHNFVGEDFDNKPSEGTECS
jgi:hypothetical protein